MFRLSRFPILKATTFKKMQTNYFQAWAKLPLACINIATLLVKTLFNKLLKCLILTFREFPKPRDWYLKLSNRSETSHTEQQHSSWFSCQITERSGYFNINIAAAILQESWCQLSPNRKAERKNGSKTHSVDPPRTPASAPPPHRHSGNKSTWKHWNTKSDPLSDDHSATAPHKWKRTLLRRSVTRSVGFNIEMICLIFTLIDKSMLWWLKHVISWEMINPLLFNDI